MRPPLTERAELVTTFDVLAMIHRYKPQTELVTRYWDHGLREFTVEHLGARSFPSMATAKSRMYVFVKATAFALSEDCAWDIDDLWHPERVERYLAHPNRRDGDRAELVFIARMVTKHAPWPPPPLKDTSKLSPWRPYTDAELDRFWHLAERQSTAARCRHMRAVLAIGLGAGLRSDEMPWVQIRDIEFTDSGLWLAVGEQWARRVPIVARYEAVFADLCDGRDPDEFLTGKRPVSYTTDYRAWLVDPTPTDGTKPRKLAPLRLRGTWVARHLQRGVPFGDVMAAAGHIDVRTLNDIVQTLHPQPPAHHHQLLREAPHG